MSIDVYRCVRITVNLLLCVRAAECEGCAVARAWQASDSFR